MWKSWWPSWGLPAFMVLENVSVNVKQHRTWTRSVFIAVHRSMQKAVNRLAVMVVVRPQQPAAGIFPSSSNFRPSVTFKGNLGWPTLANRICQMNIFYTTPCEGGQREGYIKDILTRGKYHIVQELCESRGGRPGLSVLTSLLVSVDVKIYCTVLRHWSQLVPNMSHDIWGH